MPYGYYRCYSSACKAINIRREKLEETFLNYLESLRPCTDFLTLFEAVVMDAWESSRAETVTLAASLEAQIKVLEDKKERLEEAFIYKNAIDQSTYQRHKNKLSAEILTKQIELSEAQIEELNIEGAISFARQMLGNAAALWRGFSPEQRKRFQKVIFPEGLTFADGRFGTTATNPIFNHLQEERGQKEEIATRHGFEP